MKKRTTIVVDAEILAFAKSEPGFKLSPLVEGMLRERMGMDYKIKKLFHTVEVILQRETNLSPDTIFDMSSFWLMILNTVINAKNPPEKLQAIREHLIFSPK